jgi:hypothetical protein
MAAVRALTAPARTLRSARIASTIRRGVWAARCGAGQHRPGGRLGIDRVALAAAAAGGAVGAVSLQHLHALAGQEPCQPGAVGAGALHPDRAELPVATKPPQQLPVAVGVGGNSASASSRPCWSTTAPWWVRPWCRPRR